ncbi:MULTISPECIES: YcxB family protein [unclassified Streptomyces]|uniref:YcxB family protein n=1 Tax=unclassified Streptomyces TaxID=2593676 RepID=UPI00324EFE2C
MVMNMGRDATEQGGVVELEYQPVVGDFAAALRERRRLIRAGRLRNMAVVLLAVGFVLNAGIGLVGGDVDWFLLIWLPMLGALLFFAPQLQARQFIKLAARNGTFRATVTDTGLTMVNDNSTTSVKWAAQPRYRETGDAFITYSDDKNASCFTVLPKRGLKDPADADRLREILDRNLTRA